MSNNTRNLELHKKPDKNESKSKCRIGEFHSVEDFTKTGLQQIMTATKATNAFPSGSSRDLYCAHPTFGKIIDQQSDRIMGILSQVMKQQNIKGNIQRRQQDEQFEMLLECNDFMLERINSNLDELAGIKKNPQTILVESQLPTYLTPGRGAGSWNLKKNEPTLTSARLITAKNIARPQISFRTPVDNSPNNPFVPRLKDKPNSIKPLALLPEYDEAGNIESYLHPYEFELMKFEPTENMLGKKTPVVPLEPEQTELNYIDTVDKLKEILNELRSYTEIAIDVEHHSYRTFLGITCLVQISTRDKDYLIDVIELREDVHILNEVFTNSKILKIFHGGDLDIEWLQRDLSLYIVNMFDTHQAAKLLNFPRLSLAYLLKHYCNIEADKTFQLADWRIRPLPEQLIKYARQDTHFLIYIYEMINNDLLTLANGQTNLLKTVYQKSTEICKKRYLKPRITPESHVDMYRKSKRIFDNRQLFALREIFQWRDKMARQEDESNGYVLPNHMMLQISESLPREMQGILACCNPIPPLVRQNLHNLHQIILKAREQPLVKPIIEEQIVNRVLVPTMNDYNSKLYCPHDLSHLPEFRDDLPTLLKMEENFNELIEKAELCKPVLSVFDTPENSEAEDEIKQKLEKLRKIKFVSPYERYLAAIPLIEKEKLEEAARLEAENKTKLLCPIKAEPNVDSTPTPIVKPDPEDDIYSLPLKESLKRKRETKTANNDHNAKKPKPVEVTTNSDDNLKFFDLTKTQVNNSKKESNEPQQGSSRDQTEEHLKSNDYDRRNINQNRNKNKKFKNRVGQSSDQAVQFDYKNVDFKKFQGGSQRARGTELKAKFHGKGSNNKVNNKKFNKLFTFSNVNKKK